MKNSKPNFAHLIGISYAEMNCLQLCQKFYKDVLNIELKHYCDEVPVKRSDIKNLIYSNVGDFEKVDDPKFGDLVLMKVHGLESHIGVYIDSDHILHAGRIVGSVLDRHERWKHLIGGYYRVKEQK